MRKYINSQLIFSEISVFKMFYRLLEIQGSFE